MISVWAVSGGEAAAWIAALAGGAALLKQIYDGLKKRKKEHDEIEDALAHAPQVRHQLELGNVGEAVKHLNVIIDSQNRHIAMQDTRLTTCDGEIQRLKEHNEALEAEAEGWETKYRTLEREVELDKLEANRKIASLEAEVQELKRSFARRLDAIRAQFERGEEK